MLISIFRLLQKKLRRSSINVGMAQVIDIAEPLPAQQHANEKVNSDFIVQLKNKIFL